MKEIFEKIKGRRFDWDWFGFIEQNDFPPKKYDITEGGRLRVWYDMATCLSLQYSLADLLANKSWCNAVWQGECFYCSENKRKNQPKSKFCLSGWHSSDPYYKEHSHNAFQILQQEGQDEAIKYIKQTMI